MRRLHWRTELMRETSVLPPLKGKCNNPVFDSADETFKMPTSPSKLLEGSVGSPTKKLVLRLPGRNKPAPADHKSATTSSAKPPTELPPITEKEAESSQGSLPTTLAVKPSKAPRFAMLRDRLAGKIGWRALFSRKTWLKKYREVENLSPTVKPVLNRTGGATPRSMMTTRRRRSHCWMTTLAAWLCWLAT
jgi:hypothetical protein